VKSISDDAYARSGVDTQLAGRVKKSIATHAAATFRPGVTGMGFFGGMFPLRGYRAPVLVGSTDGVGTKVKIAALMHRDEVVGMDIVNHCVNDILCCGAEPLFFLDYIATDRIVPDQVEAIVSGIAEACQDVGCSLIGGETAEMPGVYRESNYDVAGFIVGVVEEESIISGSAAAVGDTVIGFPSSGLHTNGYSLARMVFGVDSNPSILDKPYPELGQTLAEALLQVHTPYYPRLKPILPLVKSLAHITGGGFAGNIPRALPEGLGVHLHKEAWQIPPIFTLIQREGRIEEAEMYRVFNMGVGMTAVASPASAGEIAAMIPEARMIGQVVEAEHAAKVTLD